MPVTNNNRPMIDQPIWEQMTSLPAATAAGVAFADDNKRFIYILFSATSFYRYDTWTGVSQLLASPPGGTLAAGSSLRYVEQIGEQLNGVSYGSVYALIASGTAVVFYKYSIASNTWSAALSVLNIPATFGTDGKLFCPEPQQNAYQGGYHSNVALNTITLTAAASINATTLTISALPLAMPIGARLNFGTASAPLWAVLTVAATAGATSLTVSLLLAAISNSAVAFWYADMFLIGNATTQMYRYNFASNLWHTTSANAANPAFPALPSAASTGASMCWLPVSGAQNALDSLIIIRGAGSSTIYEYNLSTNTIATLSYNPNSETFATGSSYAPVSDASGKNKKLLIRKDATGRIFEFNRLNLTMMPVATQNLFAESTAVVGDKMSVLRSPDGIDYLYLGLNTSAIMVRTGLFL